MSFHKIALSTLTATLLLSGYANANTFPHGCEVTGFGFNQNHLLLNDTGQQSFYLIQNRSNTKIELQRVEDPNVFMSPPLTAQLEPSNWAAFASDVQNYHFQCFSTANENVAKIDCSNVLEVCQYPRVKFALSNMGNYWVSTNKAQNQVINEAAAKGILLRW